MEEAVASRGVGGVARSRGSRGVGSRGRHNRLEIGGSVDG